MDFFDEFISKSLKLEVKHTLKKHPPPISIIMQAHPHFTSCGSTCLTLLHRSRLQSHTQIGQNCPTCLSDFFKNKGLLEQPLIHHNFSS